MESNYLNEQLLLRQKLDQAALEDSIRMMNNALQGEKDPIGKRGYGDVAGSRSCVEVVLKAFGFDIPDIPKNLTTLNDQLTFAAQPKGIFWRDVKLEKNWYKDAIGVMVGFDTADHSPMVLIPGKTSGYDVYDPRDPGRRKISAAVLKTLDTNAILFYKPLPQKSLTVKDLIRFMSSLLTRGDIVAVVLASLAVALVGLIPAYASKVIFENVVGHDVSILYPAMGLLFGAAIGKICAEIIKQLVIRRIETRISVPTEAAFTARLISLPMEFFSDTTSGEMGNRVGLVAEMCKNLVTSVLGSGFTCLFSLVYLGQVIGIASAMLLPTLLIICVSMAFSIISAFKSERTMRRQAESSAKTNGMELQILGGIRKFRLARAEKRAYAKWAETYSNEVSAKYNLPFFYRYNNSLQKTVILLGTVLLFFVAARNQLTTAEYMAFSVSYGQLMVAVGSVTAVSMAIAGIRPQLEMVRPILEAVPENSGNKKIVTELHGNIELDHVSFRYDNKSPWIFENLSLKIKAGQYVAVVGKTGCGKTSLVKLLLNYVYPQKGFIYYDGKDSKTLDSCSLRRKIGTVSQDGRLLEGSIYSNIVLSAPYLSEKEAWEAAELADIAEDIRNMPMGMHTRVSEEGNVSGGQRQRIMIARALAPRPKILIFDEGTSALDNLSQKSICNSLEKLECTRIVIAHRLSTIKDCDRILMMESGRIVEDGTYEELIERRGSFYDLVKRQQLEEN